MSDLGHEIGDRKESHRKSTVQKKVARTLWEG